MTTPDTKAIRARMEALVGFSAGPWIYYADLPSVEPNWHIVTTSNKMRVLANVHIEPGNAMDVANASLIAAAPDMRETILALCDALDAERADNERLQTIIGNLHTVEEELSETAKAQFHRANRLRAENQRLRNFIVDFSETKFDRIDRRSLDPQDDLDPITDYMAIEAWQEDARAALATMENQT